MTRADLIEVVRETLSRAGFTVSERCDLRPVSFDLVARRDRELRMVKVLSNVDALSEAIAQEIKVLCKFLDARPVLVGLRSGTSNLEPGVVYNRHDIPIMTPETLEQVLRGEPPMVFAAPGGFYVHIDAQALRRAREQAQLSLGVVAQVAGVSRRAIQMYEEGMSASIDAAMRLEEFLQAELIRPINPFDAFDPSLFQPPEAPGDAGAEDPMEALVRRMLEGLGYEVRATRRSPFNALTTQEADTLLTGMGEDSPQLRRRARVVTSVSHVTGRPGFFVVEHTTRTTLEGMPVVTRTELKRLDDPQAILQLILERQGRAAQPE
ncbi:MAG TPA: transcriptional regulator [Candidatus Thermoplasmatota archaeon]|nr:transcriptional regulator [Candidatus Thermoplasmatota archaeon]